MLTHQTLIDDLARGCKPKSAFRIGLEHEQFLICRDSGKAPPYDRDSSDHLPGLNSGPTIRALLERLAGHEGWAIDTDQGRPIGLHKDGQNVSLEPGGQFEFSGSPCPDLNAARAEMDQFYAMLAPHLAALGLDALATGMHPHWRRADVRWMPKTRYAIMRPYMEKKGRLGIDMMGRTCGSQINLDFSSEEDMVRKFRVAVALQPLIIALMAGSRLVEGKDSGYASYRAHIWTDTDPDRCGLPGFVFAKDMSFARYVDYALDVPMYFIRRPDHHSNGQYHDVSGLSFRDFMAGKLPGFEGQYPALSDWHDHLSTLFPIVRLKTYLELRGPDSAPPDMVYAMAAFWAGLLYDEQALTQCAALIESWPLAAHQQLHDQVAQDGLETKMPGSARNGAAESWHTLRGMAPFMLDLAARGLQNQPAGENYAAWLAPFYARLETPGSAAKINAF